LENHTEFPFVEGRSGRLHQTLDVRVVGLRRFWFKALTFDEVSDAAVFFGSSVQPYPRLHIKMVLLGQTCKDKPLRLGRMWSVDGMATPLACHRLSSNFLQPFAQGC
jgi:hypothetical protein